MDWLILNKGPMLYKEKDNENQAADTPLEALPREIRELVAEAATETWEKP